jgi:hypothetical protein
VEGYALDVSLPKFINQSPRSHVTVFGDWAFVEIIKAKWGHESGVLIWEYWCPYKKRHQSTPPCEDTVRSQPSLSQEENPNWTLTLQTPWSWTSSFHNYENTGMSCLVIGIYSEIYIVWWPYCYTNITVYSYTNYNGYDVTRINNLMGSLLCMLSIIDWNVTQNVSVNV